MVEMLRPFNFSSFLDLYKYIQDSALAGEKEIRIQHLERGKVTETLVLELEYIKARAFEEIYPRLATKKTRDFLIFCASNMIKDPEAPIFYYLQGLPTRNLFKGEELYPIPIPTRNP